MLFFFSFSAGISVSISTFSLVAIAIERYSAICNPLKSRVWQTRSHAYRVIAATWVMAFLIMIPYPIISHLDSFQRADNTTAHQCRHKWPIATAEQTWWVIRFKGKKKKEHIWVFPLLQSHLFFFYKKEQMGDNKQMNERILIPHTWCFSIKGSFLE